MSLLVLFGSFLLEPPREGRRLPPVDSCASDSSFVAFRSELLRAIERRDADHVLSIVADDIQIDFGGGSGRDQFARNWNFADPGESRLWQTLSAALRLGCARGEEGAYWAPSLFLADDIADPVATLLVVRPNAPLHETASEDSVRIGTLNWDLVEAVERQEGDDWWRVRLADGREGFMRRSDLRSPLDYRAAFERIDGRWRMTSFIAGD